MWREIPGVTQVDEKGREGNAALVVTAYLCWMKHGQRNSRTGGAPADYVLSCGVLWTSLLKKKTSSVRSRISSKRIFASCVGYFDRAYYGSSVTSSNDVSHYWAEQNLTAVELSECTNTKYVAWICMRPYLHWLDVILLTAVWGRGIHALLGEHRCDMTRWTLLTLYMSRRTFFWPFHHQVMSDDIDDIQDPRYHMRRRTIF